MKAKKAMVYIGLAVLFSFVTPFSVFAQGRSRQSGQVSQTVSLSRVHTTNTLNAHYIIPPKNFDPMTATNSQLKKYGLPVRPKKKSKLKSWKEAMSNFGQFVKPAFKVIPSHSNSVYRGYSKNWSGYEVRDPNFEMNEVDGKWTVPNIYRTDRTAYSVSWVGLDGDSYGSGHLIQAGTAQDYVNSQYKYYFWWEQITPSSDTHEVKITSLPVHPGDKVFVYIDYSSSSQKAQYIINNVTTGYSTDFTKSAGSAYYGYTAEWIEERTKVNNKFPNLADFYYVIFNDLHANSGSGAGGALGNWANIHRINMTSTGTSSGTPLADTSSIGSDNKSFDVSWKHYN